MYTIKELSLMSGLTDRTLRNYLKLGILQGEKQDGAWLFSVEQIEAFFQNPAAAAAMESNRKAVVFDFLAMPIRKENAACIVLDLPTEEPAWVAKFFCEAVNRRQGLTMTFSKERHRNRVILAGSEETVLDVLCEYNKAKQE